LEANFRACFAELFVFRSSEQHQMGRCATNFCARQHQAKMCWFCVVTTQLKAVVYGGACAGSIADETAINTFLHFGSELNHDYLLCQFVDYRVSSGDFYLWSEPGCRSKALRSWSFALSSKSPVLARLP
jgi:hypothetical protein